ncbi:MAG: RNA polymerase factor sigma-54 [Alphaproteobacteria bacterium]|jgi:RNA polymerase sigma-54 factor
MPPPAGRTIGPRLDLRQSQALVMTPQLQQAIKLLQLSNAELVAFVETELERNPLLEREDPDGPAEPAERATDLREAAPILDPIAGGGGASPAGGDAAPRDEAPLDADFSNSFDEGPGDSPDPGGWDGPGARMGGGGGADFDDGDFAFENTLTRAKTLREHLLDQVAVEIRDPVDRILAEQLVNQVDEAGYLQADVAQLAAALRCPVERVERVVARLQRFDPPGICARSLRECLALQLRERDRLDPAMEALLDNLPLLARRDIPALLKACGVDAADLADMAAEIRALDPKPGQRFDGAPAQPIIPDVLMRPASGGGWIIELNQDTLPRVLVNLRYHARVNGRLRGRGDKEFLADQLQSANWLVKSLHQRAQTILKVSSEIVRQQDAFFAHGVQFMRPLVLRDIAAAIEMHESTVSRVTTNKFLASPHGVFELKYFFTSSISDTAGGEGHSAEAVRHRIRALIDAEAPAKVLSDDALVDILKAEGIDIARRTVAKYREALHIPSSVQRRREKALGL